MSPQQKALVLLGEDDWAQAEVLLEVLSDEGYGVLCARNPQEVLRQLSPPPDVLLLDVRGVSSPEVLRALETMLPRPILVVVSADAHVAEFARGVNADAFIRKPYELDELLEAMVRLLELRRSPVQHP